MAATRSVRIAASRAPPSPAHPVVVGVDVRGAGRQDDGWDLGSIPRRDMLGCGEGHERPAPRWATTAGLRCQTDDSEPSSRPLPINTSVQPDGLA